MLSPGDQVGDWEVVALLGEGGMGAVYRARNRLIGVDAALKTLKPHQVEYARERFLREVRTLYQLRHDAVVRVSAFGEDAERGLLWMAMELVEGEELAERIARGPSSEAEALRLFLRLAEGLAHAHARSVFHRDLKPANVLVREDGLPVLVDFGIATEDGGTKYTRTGMVAGTPTYMAPEVFTGESPPEPALLDVYAMGQMLWEVLAGRDAFPPIQGLSASQQMARLMGAKMQSEPLDPGEGVAPDLRAVVIRASDPEPANRYADASALHAALRAVDLDARRPTARAPTATSPETTFVRRDPPSRPPPPAPAVEETTPLDVAEPPRPSQEAALPTASLPPPAPSRSGARLAAPVALVGCAGLLVLGAAALGLGVALRPGSEPPEPAVVEPAVVEPVVVEPELGEQPSTLDPLPEAPAPLPPRLTPAPAPAPARVAPEPAPIAREPVPAPVPEPEPVGPAPAPEPAPVAPSRAPVPPDPVVPAPVPAAAPATALTPEQRALEEKRQRLLALATRDWGKIAYKLSADDPSGAPLVKSFLSRHGNLEVREGELVEQVHPPEVEDALAWLRHWGVEP